MEIMKQGFGVGMHPSLNTGHLSGRYSPPYRPPERMRCMSASTVCNIKYKLLVVRFNFDNDQSYDFRAILLCHSRQYRVMNKWKRYSALLFNHHLLVILCQRRHYLPCFIFYELSFYLWRPTCFVHSGA